MSTMRIDPDGSIWKVYPDDAAREDRRQEGWVYYPDAGTLLSPGNVFSGILVKDGEYIETRALYCACGLPARYAQKVDDDFVEHQCSGCKNDDSACRLDYDQHRHQGGSSPYLGAQERAKEEVSRRMGGFDLVW